MPCPETVPEHLWRENKEILNGFSPNEEFLRRIYEDCEWEPKTLISNRSLANKIFPCNNESYNSFSLCQERSDVLISPVGEDLENNGVISCIHNRITTAFLATHKDSKGAITEFGLNIEMTHDPLECNYSHCLAILKVDGQDYTSENERTGGQNKAIRNSYRLFCIKNHEKVKIDS